MNEPSKTAAGGLQGVHSLYRPKVSLFLEKILLSTRWRMSMNKKSIAPHRYHQVCSCARTLYILFYAYIIVTRVRWWAARGPFGHAGIYIYIAI